MTVYSQILDESFPNPLIKASDLAKMEGVLSTLLALGYSPKDLTLVLDQYCRPNSINFQSTNTPLVTFEDPSNPFTTMKFNTSMGKEVANKKREIINYSFTVYIDDPPITPTEEEIQDFIVDEFRDIPVELVNSKCEIAHEVSDYRLAVHIDLIVSPKANAEDSLYKLDLLALCIKKRFSKRGSRSNISFYKNYDSNEEI